jgi:hypothetical protein
MLVLTVQYLGIYAIPLAGVDTCLRIKFDCHFRQGARDRYFARARAVQAMYISKGHSIPHVQGAFASAPTLRALSRAVPTLT